MKMLRRIFGGRTLGAWSVRFEVKVEDCWIGAYWRRSHAPELAGYPRRVVLDVWICVVPMLALHVRRVGPDPYYDCSALWRHKGPWQHVPPSDSVEQCLACGEMIGK